ncbi:MAG: alpha/beta fold hydrolase [Ktedonobacteraceae bacterium]
MIPPTKNWIFGARPNPAARVRLFCFPFAGGGASTYYPWISLLAPEIDVYPVQFPGRENRVKEPPLRRLDGLIQALAQALQPYFDMPYAFFGHSMGALVSFELTRQLRQQGARLPEHLFLSAYRSPETPSDEPRQALPESALSDSALMKTLLELDGTSPEILANEELRQLLLPILRADFAVCESYQFHAQEPLACPITVLGGQQDKRVQQAKLETWRKQTSQDFATHMLLGNHLFIRPAQAAVLQIISQALVTKTADVPLGASL